MATTSIAIDFQLGTAGAPSTEADYSTSVQSLNWDRTRDILEANVFGVSSKRYAPGLSEASFTVDLYYTTALEDAMHDLLEYSGTDVDFIIGPNGIASGQPKYTGQALIKSVKRAVKPGDIAVIACEFTVNSTVGRTTY